MIRYFNSLEASSFAAAEWLVDVAINATASRGVFLLALSGGSTPLALFELLASDEFKFSIPWQNTHIFWVDERFVPPQHADSNYKVAFNAFISKVPVFEQNIHRIKGELATAFDAANDYEADLKAFFPNVSFPVFDFILMGMGEDGHTASIFPNSKTLSEQTRWVVDASPPSTVEPHVSRITMTLPVLNNGRNTLFMISGRSKCDIADAIHHNLLSPSEYPVVGITNSGNLQWFASE